MTDFMTRLALVGAAATAVAAAIAAAKCKIENGKCKMMESSSFDRKGQIHHSTFSIFNSKFSIHAAVFAFFAGVAVQYAGAKHGGTNAPPNGASPPQMVPSGGGNVELIMENVELQSMADFVSKMAIALKECGETSYWLELLVRTEYISQKEFSSIVKDCKELFALLTAIVKTSRRER